MLRAIELFAGAGGLALASSGAGFRHQAVIERNRDACETLRRNRDRGVEHVATWPIHETDVRTFDYSGLSASVDLVAGGPPCQPFSLGGKHRGHADERNMFPEAVRAVRELAPRAFVFENVRGLTRQSFLGYFEYIILQLTHPEVERRPDEDWESHLARLERHHTAGGIKGLSYNVVYRVLDAADFGVPQHRLRVFIVGFRSDIGIDWSFPEPTHSEDALLHDKWVSGDYWKRHDIPPRRRPAPAERELARVRVLESSLFPPTESPWRTVRDAIASLPEPTSSSSPLIENHVLNPGARPYAGHTGSRIDEPAKTLKAGDHGVPGGENMLALPDGSVRYFTVRESARLQTFPDSFTFSGAWSECMRQLGNAVPVQLGMVVMRDVGARLGMA